MKTVYMQGPHPSSEYRQLQFFDCAWEDTLLSAQHGGYELCGYAPASSVRSRLLILFDTTGGDFSEPGVEIVPTLGGYRRRSLLSGEWLGAPALLADLQGQPQ